MPTKPSFSQFLKRFLTTIFVIFLLIFGGLIGVAYKNPGSAKNLIGSFLSRGLGLTSSQTVTNTTQTVVEEESAVISAVNKVSPSVVSVVASQSGVDPFSGQTQTQEQGIGTGFIVEAGGVILTNKHVVSTTGLQYTVVLKDKTSYPVKNVYLDPSNDLALIKIEASNLPAVEFGDSSKIRVGQTVIAIGNALGRFDNTVTRGVVSAMGRGITASSGNPFDPQTESLEDVIQTDASLNPGNSGGPLVNLSGQVIGMNSAVTSGAQGIGFAIPINSIKPVIDSFQKNGRIVRPYLGVVYQMVTSDMTVFTRLPEGALVQRVVATTPAEKAGLKNGDVILKINEDALSELTPLSQVILKHQVGDTVTLTVDRGGATQTVSVVLGEAPSQ